MKYIVYNSRIRRLKRISFAILIMIVFLMNSTLHATEPPGDEFGNSYQAIWASLKDHAIPKWLVDAKFGIWTHWGVYAVPAFGHEWYPRKMYIQSEQERGNYFYYHRENYGPHNRFGYHDFVPMFKTENFDAERWATLFKKAGAKFAGPVAEHHDGFAMWNSDLTEWDAADKGPKTDLVGAFADALRDKGMTFVTSLHHFRKWWYYETSYTQGDKYHTKDPRYAGVYKLYPPPHEEGAFPGRAYLKACKEKVYTKPRLQIGG